MSVLFNDALNTFYLWLYDVLRHNTSCGRQVKHRHKQRATSGREEMGWGEFYLTTHLTHFIYGYMMSYGTTHPADNK